MAGGPFTSVDLVRAVIYAGFWFWQWTMMTSSSRRWYRRLQKRTACAPPGWFFGVAWGILYTLLGVSVYLYDRNFFGVGGYVTVIMWLVLGNALLNKLWSVLFFDRGMSFIALLVLAIGILPTAVLVPIFMALDVAWVSFGLWVAYPLWLCIAAYLNWVAFRYQLLTKDEAESLLPTNQSMTRSRDEAPMVISNPPTQKVLVFGYDT